MKLAEKYASCAFETLLGKACPLVLHLRGVVQDGAPTTMSATRNSILSFNLQYIQGDALKEVPCE